MGRAKGNPEENVMLLKRLRMAAEVRESRAHLVAAALDECLTLLLQALLQAERTPRGMQSRRAKRLRAKFLVLRLNALEGKSPCDPSLSRLEVESEAMDGQNTVVK